MNFIDSEIKEIYEIKEITHHVLGKFKTMKVKVSSIAGFEIVKLDSIGNKKPLESYKIGDIILI